MDEEKAGSESAQLNTSFLSISAVAEKLGVSRWTVGRMLDEGDLPFVPVRGTPRIDPVDLDKWIAEKKAAALREAAERKALAEAKRGRPVGRPRKEFCVDVKRPVGRPRKDLSAVADASR